MERLDNVSFAGQAVPSGETVADDSRSKTTLDLWEMDPMFKCPLFGACLTLTEQKRLLKKIPYPFKGKSAFEIHEMFMTLTARESLLSQNTNQLLRGKYMGRAEPMMKLAEGDYIKAWTRVFNEGEFALAVYAAAARKNNSPETKRRLFGIIHMAMHEVPAAKSELRKEAVKAEKRARKAEKAREEMSGLIKELKKENRELKGSLQVVRVELSRLRTEADCSGRADEGRPVLSSPPAPDGPDSTAADRESGEPSRLVKALERSNADLERRLQEERKSGAMIRRHLASLLGQMADAPYCDESCPSYDLCEKRILVVGGISKMAHHYREIVEAGGGRFEYHNGNVKNGVRKLESRFKRADVVLCPVDCNSHAACAMVKKLGKKHNKPVRMLFGSSINAIAQGLMEGPAAGLATRAEIK